MSSQRAVEGPAPGGEEASGPPIGGGKAFSVKCGTYTRLVRPARGPARWVCPKCHPEMVVAINKPRIDLDKTGMPCKDRGVCRPERCLMAFECEEMKRLK